MTALEENVAGDAYSCVCSVGEELSNSFEKDGTVSKVKDDAFVLQSMKEMQGFVAW